MYKAICNVPIHNYTFVLFGIIWKKNQPTGMIHVNMYLNFCLIFLQWSQGCLKNNQFKGG